MTYNRKDLAVKVDIKSIKGYTMREIGALDERIKKLEYYTVLNALELDVKTLSVKDDTGNLDITSFKKIKINFCVDKVA